MTDLERIQDYIDNRIDDEPEKKDLWSAEELGDKKCSRCWGHGSYTDHDGDDRRRWTTVLLCDCVLDRVEKIEAES